MVRFSRMENWQTVEISLKECTINSIAPISAIYSFVAARGALFCPTVFRGHCFLAHTRVVVNINYFLYYNFDLDSEREHFGERIINLFELIRIIC